MGFFILLTFSCGIKNMKKIYLTKPRSFFNDIVVDRYWIHSVQPKGHLPCCDFLLPSRRDSRLWSRIFPFCINQDFRVTKRAIDRNKASKRRKDGWRALHFLARMGARYAWTRGGHEEIWTLNAIKSASFCCNMEGSAFPSKNRPNPGQGIWGSNNNSTQNCKSGCHVT